MPKQTANCSCSHVKLAKLFLAAGLATVVFCFGLIVWRLAQLPRSGHSAAKQQLALVRPATSQQKIAIERVARPESSLEAASDPLVISGHEQERLNTVRKEPVIAAFPRLPDLRTRDRVVEQRLRASEDELRSQLRAVPELRLLSDGEVQKVRKEQMAIQWPALAAVDELMAGQGELNAARSRLDSARTNWKTGRMTADAYREAVATYKEVCRSYNQIARRVQAASKRRPEQGEQERIGYDFNLRLHQGMKRAAVQAGLELGSGPNCQLDPSIAAQVAKLSKDLRDKGFVAVPRPSFVRQDNQGHVIIEGGEASPRTGGIIIEGSKDSGGVFINGQRLRPPDEKDEDRAKWFQTWCDQHRLEELRGTVPTLTQMLQIEDEPTRLLLVRELTRIDEKAATVGLAVRALVDLSPAVRRAALAGLEQRPPSEYLPVLLWGLRYPWPPVADHAAVALRTLKPQEAVWSLVDLLDLPSPSAPVLDAKTKQYTMREVIRLNHLRNCLLCHAPSANQHDGLVRGLVPTPGRQLPIQYYESQVGDFVRADMTFLRQDFSVSLLEKDAAPWPKDQRYDFATRLRTVPSDEVANLPALSANYPQREAVLYALRGITGKSGGDSSDEWRKTLGFAIQATEMKKDAALDRTTIPPKDSIEALRKSEPLTNIENPKP